MRTIRLTVAYDGTAYAGWQVQPDARTVQGELESAVEKVTGRRSRVTASGRTDAGVHATGQVVAFHTECSLAVDVLRRALNARLPRDVAVLEAADAREGFHPIRDAVGKRYRYVIHDGPVRDVFSRCYAWHYRQSLDVAAMARAARTLWGKHDFASFQNSGSERLTTVRTIQDIDVRRIRGAGQGGDRIGQDDNRTGQGRESEIFRQVVPPIIIEVQADGFLYNMVRAIVGTLVEVGRGARAESWVAEVLAAADRSAAGPAAPPQGLFLVKVDYPTPCESRTSSHD